MKMEINKLKTHPLNRIFGDLPKQEFDALKKDIELRGVQTRIDISEGNVIVCGHQRVKACKELKIREIKVRILKNWTEDKIREHLIKDNVLRRQLNEQQLAASGKELERIYEGRHGGDRAKAPIGAVGKTTELVAKELSISGRSYERIKKVSEMAVDDKGIKELWNGGKKASAILRDHKIQEQVKEIRKLKPTKKIKGVFDVIVIDPPWNYGIEYDPDSHRGTAPYPTMTLEEIMNIKLPSDDNCILWLWTTNTFLKDAFTVAENWGFEVKSILTWDKEFLGVGRWLRNITEHCLLCVKGKPVWTNKKWTTLISEKRKAHSEKPELFYEMVEDICHGRKLDYFARKKRKGWDVYGDEI